MKKILAMAAVVALTAGVSGYAANVNDNVKFSGDVNVKYLNVKNNDDPIATRVRLQADANLTDEVAVSGRVAFSNLFNVDNNDVKHVALDRLHVVYSPVQVEGLKLDLGRTGVTLGSDKDVFDNSFDGAVVSYAKDQYAVEAGCGKVRLSETFNVFTDVKDVDNLGYLKGSFDVNNQVKVGGFFVRSLGENKVNVYGINADADVAENVSVFGDIVKVDAPKDPTVKVIGVKYGNVNDTVGSWEAKLKYYDADLNANLENLGISENPSMWKAEAKATVYEDVTLKAALQFNQKNSAGVKVDNIWGLELNYAF
ncbi:hypothetical protein [Dialister micraerophilus]|uniref:Porin domain-containing protein n=1 Tax=Dialister micraerophilus UPII 345-E TaxID=910314 RepID=E4L9F4_9FIRM|nr:hypothetical protein [Dialister micraerophilus]EFR42499.1 hypothetical protein HMPREF9220_0378 [Dialister micraerophilus UPII 345-E]